MAEKKRETLAQFKKRVVQAVVDVDGGCSEGKREFLESLDLEFPSANLTITLTLDMDVDGDVELSDVKSAIEGYGVESMVRDAVCEYAVPYGQSDSVDLWLDRVEVKRKAA